MYYLYILNQIEIIEFDEIRVFPHCSILNIRDCFKKKKDRKIKPPVASRSDLSVVAKVKTRKITAIVSAIRSRLDENPQETII